MVNKNLKYFMREELKTEEVIEMQGPETIKDENGKPVVFQMKRLSQERIDKIYDHYKTLRPAFDKNKKPYVVDGKMVMREEKDYGKALRHVLVESLVYPDLHDEELLKFYNCTDVTELPRKMFTKAEYDVVINMLNKVLGISDETEEEAEDDLEAAKK